MQVDKAEGKDITVYSVVEIASDSGNVSLVFGPFNSKQEAIHFARERAERSRQTDNLDLYEG